MTVSPSSRSTNHKEDAMSDERAGAPEWTPCFYCEGEGYIEDVDDMTASWLECEFCEGTGDRFGRGHTLPNPSPETA
jgi:hypothetical protein